MAAPHPAPGSLVASLLQGRVEEGWARGVQRSLFQLQLWHLQAAVWVAVQRCVSQGLCLNPGQRPSPT